jgi:hypothetical protein
MLTVEGLIGDLLIQHNCVVVPSFGGFVAQRVPAQIDTEKGVAVPPSKSILFNRQLINNDGLLIAAFAHGNKVEYAQAQTFVTEAIAGWEQQLKSGNRITIDRVGFLFLDNERNLCFEQDRFYNLLLASYGLGSVHFVSASDVEAKNTIEGVHTLVLLSESEMAAPVIEFNGEAIVPVAVENETAPIISIAAKKANKSWRYLAAACILPIAFYSFWIPMKTDVLESGIITLADFNPFYHYAPASYQRPSKHYHYNASKVLRQLATIPQNVATFSYEIDSDTYVPVRLMESVAEQPVSVPVAKALPTSSATSHIIVGSYSTRENAETLIHELKLKGIHATLLETDSKFRVSAGNGAEMAGLLPQLKAAGLSPWILK